MLHTTNSGKVRGNFGFPFPPYPIQEDFMNYMYDAIDQGLIGIFESPTGTGKTLSMTCAALCWLEDNEEMVEIDALRRISELSVDTRNLVAESDASTDWITMQAQAAENRQEIARLRWLLEIRQKFKDEWAKIVERHGKKHAEMMKNPLKSILDGMQRKEKNEEEKLPTVVVTDAEKIGEEEDPEEGRYRPAQVFFTSRTHSQLAQVQQEVKKTRFAKSVRCIAMASRQHLCINPDIRKLPVAIINERCKELSEKARKKVKIGGDDGDAPKAGNQENKPNTKSTGTIPKVKSNASRTAAQAPQPVAAQAADTSGCGCPYKNPTKMKLLSEEAQLSVMDIEDLVARGKKLGACPYYATREASKTAQMVLLPYPMLLNSATRKQIGLDIRQSVIIIDEAHNLLEAMSSMHSCRLSMRQLRLLFALCSAYRVRYGVRLQAAHALRVNQLIYIIKRLINNLKVQAEIMVPVESMSLLSYELASDGEFFTVNLREIIQFLNETHFDKKLRALGTVLARHSTLNFSQELADAAKVIRELGQTEYVQYVFRPREGRDYEETKDSPPTLPSIQPLQSFLEALTENTKMGRVLVKPHIEVNNSEYFYMVLNPAEHFSDVLNEARSVIIAGGTMQPVEELTSQLLVSCPGRIKVRFYDHIVPQDAVLPVIIRMGPTKVKYNFRHESRREENMVTELGRALVNISNVTPGGVVCFLPSYDYLDDVYHSLEFLQVWASIGKRKKVFCDSRTGMAQPTEELLKSYSEAVKAGGAFLLSVVGGKLSEGLNFSDDLGRCIVVVGMPYPQQNSPEMKERLAYIKETQGETAGAAYYENLCMKKVNQTIGRAVRHIKDYACVVLMDERYSRRCILEKLPRWISHHTKAYDDFGLVHAEMARFFRKKRT